MTGAILNSEVLVLLVIMCIMTHHFRRGMSVQRLQVYASSVWQQCLA